MFRTHPAPLDLLTQLAEVRLMAGRNHYKAAICGNLLSSIGFSKDTRQGLKQVKAVHRETQTETSDSARITDKVKDRRIEP